MEVVTGGASAAYGSDAVGGVVNFVLDTASTARAPRRIAGTTERGDGASLGFSLAGGMPLGETAAFRGFGRVSGDRTASRPIAGRDWFQGWGRVTNPQWTATRTGPAAAHAAERDLHALHVRRPHQPAGLRPRSSDLPAGRLVQAVPGRAHRPPSARGTYSQSGGGGDNYEADSTGDGSLLPGVSRGSAFAYLNYSFTDDSYAFLQALYGRNHVDFVNVGAVQFGQWQATDLPRQRVPAGGAAPDHGERGPGAVRLLRMGSSADLGRARDIIQNDTYSFTAGAARAEWGSGVTRAITSSAENRGDTTLRDFVRTDRLSIALDAVRDPATGSIVCRSTLFNPSNGCVPIDLFGAGRASPQALDYVLDDKFGYVTVEQHFAEISADGPVAEGIGAGPVLLALGASFREDRFNQYAVPADSSISTPANDPSLGIQGIPAAFVGSFVHQFSSFPNLHGALHGEGGVRRSARPLYTDAQNVRHLSMSLAARYADYSGSGGIWAWKAGLEGHVTPDLRLRGTVVARYASRQSLGAIRPAESRLHRARSAVRQYRATA